tara:strand:+ start:72 stop:740 length:669 start_codon:yes stop_codon:yes gene_type:complete
MGFGSDIGDKTSCQISLVKLKYSEEEIAANCVPRDFKIYNNKVVEIKDGKSEDSEIVKDFTLGDDQVNELFAKLIGKCLEMGGGINSEAFGRSLLAETTACLECSSVEFDKSVNVDSFVGLREYLEENKVPGIDQKYSEFFTKDENHREDWIVFGDKKDLIPGKYEYPLRKNEIYTVFFLGIKESFAHAIGYEGKFFSRDDVYFVYAATQDKANEVCGKIVN